MNFFTKIPIQKSPNQINYNSKIVLLGSCFSENIGKKFEYFKFQNSVNPFGIIFNPVSIENLISRALNGIYFTENDIFFHDNLWKCYEVHSDLNCEKKVELIANLNLILANFKTQLLEATDLIITFGTSWIYKEISSNKLVANCHKVPQNQFLKELLSVETIEKSIQNTIDFVKKVNPNCNLIFTISPVRHIKDGFVENNQSKANLISGLQKILNPKLQILNYFPSYEIMMDELRDYRFYANDMLHPNETAIDYIWNRFSDTYFSEETSLIFKEIDSIQKAISHRSLNPNSESHFQFLKNLESKIINFTHKYPEILF